MVNGMVISSSHEWRKIAMERHVMANDHMLASHPI